MKQPRRAIRHALLVTGAAGMVAVPAAATLAVQSPRQAAAAAGRSAGVVTPAFALAAQQQQIARTVAAQTAIAADQQPQAAAAAAQAQQVAAAEAQRVAALAAQERASRSTRTELPVDPGDPRSIARAMLAARGQDAQFGCLDRLWTKESNWSISADNPSSSAYGIPQALPGSKMASAGADWRTNPATQIAWGLSYIASRYGSPCSAWGHSQSSGWY